VSIPRDHHFLPVFYLKQWASGTDGKLIEHSIKHGKFLIKRVGPQGTGFERDLYSFPELPIGAAQHMESVFLQHSDDAASKALLKHLQMTKSTWPDDLVSAWSRFIMGLLLRHPDVMKELRVAAKSLWDKGGDAIQKGYEAIRTADDPPTFEDKMAIVDPLVEIKTRLNMIIRGLNNPVIGNHINGMKWVVVDVTASPQILLTSDRPVTTYNLRKPDGNLFLPIGPTKLFVAANSQATLDKLSQGTQKSIVEKANEFVVARARRYVYSRDRFNEAYIRRHMSTKLEPTPLFPNLDRDAPDVVESA
jgi:uncharacterized protein DUF4238